MTPMFLVGALLQSAVVYLMALAATRIWLPPAPRILLNFWQASLVAMVCLPVCQLTFTEPLSAIHISAIGAAAASSLQRVPFPTARVLIFIWAVIAILRLGRLALGLVELRQIRRAARPFSDVAPQACAQSGVHIRVCESTSIRTPASYGLRTPVILVPAVFSALGEETRVAAITHELIHIQRRDWLAHLLEEVLLSFCWFHPLLFATVRHIRLYREQITDQESIRATGSRDTYLRALVAFASTHPSDLPAPCFSRARQLKQRIKAIQQESSVSVSKPSKSTIPATAFLIASMVLAIWAIPLHSSVAAGEQVYKVGGNIKAPVATSSPSAAYTPQAKAAKIEGTVTLELVIGRDGIPSDVRVTQALDPGLDQEAAKAVRNWRFTPGTKDGKPVAVRATMEIQFKLL